MPAAVRTAPEPDRQPPNDTRRRPHARQVERARPDYYRVLHVDPAANPLVIQAAYRVLAQIFHPDVSGDDAEMKRINAAWEVLGDARRRRQYDIDRAGRHQGPADGAASRPAAAAPGPRAAPEPGPSHRPQTSHGSPTATTPRQDTAVFRPRSEDRAGAPQGEPFGPMLKFGRYEGWTLGQVTRVDRPYLEWLRRVPAGRGLKDEIDAVLRTRRGPGAVDERRTYETQQRVHTWAPGAPTKLR
jgi:curved DNA-binding protein CbpA